MFIIHAKQENRAGGPRDATRAHVLGGWLSIILAGILFLYYISFAKELSRLVDLFQDQSQEVIKDVAI